jgi:hypothetical protein
MTLHRLPLSEVSDLIARLAPELAAEWTARAVRGRRQGARKVSAEGPYFRSPNYHYRGLYDAAALAVLRAAAVTGPVVKVQWWAHVLYPGAVHRPHKHPRGAWSFVVHLSDGGAALYFPTRLARFVPRPGQVIVFPWSLEHATESADAVRVAVAGNIWLGSSVVHDGN